MKSEAENKNWLNRTEALIGKESLEKLQNSNIVVFGLGGVGSYVVEGLVRAGIQNMCIIDKDIVDITNINRQLIADTETVGKAKVDVQEERILKINPLAKVTKLKEFVNKDNIEEIMNETTHIDYVVDAIDTVSAKLEIIKYCNKNNIKLTSKIIDDDIYINADYNRLTQVFINLLKNSIEAITKNKKGTMGLVAQSNTPMMG